MIHKRAKRIYNYVPIVIGNWGWSLIVRVEELLLIVASSSVRVETVSVVG